MRLSARIFVRLIKLVPHSITPHMPSWVANVLSKLLMPAYKPLEGLEVLKSETNNSPQFNAWAKKFEPSLPPFRYGRAQEQFYVAAKVCRRQHKTALDLQPHKRIEPGIVYTEALPNAVCEKLGDGHYAIGCFSGLMSVLTSSISLIANRHAIFFGNHQQPISVNHDLVYPWGFDWFFSQRNPIDEVAKASADGNFFYDFMFLSALEFIVNHEYSHIVLGHLDFQPGQYRLTEMDENEGLIDPLRRADPPKIEWQRAFCELEADGMACHLAIGDYLFDKQPPVAREIFARMGYFDEDFVYRVKFVAQMITLWTFGMGSVVKTLALQGPATWGTLLKSHEQWSNYPSIYYRMHFYRTHIFNIPQRSVDPRIDARIAGRAITSGRLWSQVESTLVRLAQYNPCFATLPIGLSRENGDKIDYDSLAAREFQDAMRPYRWTRETVPPISGVLS